VHGESGQAAVEWVALVLLAALVLTAGAALSGREDDRELGQLVAKRLVGGPGDLSRARSGPTPAARVGAPPAPRVSAPAAPRGVQAFRRLRGAGEVARRAWIVCLGYRRWRYELEHPSAPNEALPLGEALSIANTCLNPHDYLIED
jgi:hypothetical protein